jgi:hypothetical protein
LTTKEQLEKVKRANADKNARQPYLEMANKFFESITMLYERKKKKE